MSLLVDRFAIAAAVLCALGVSQVAVAGCADDLTEPPTAPITELPVACQTLGPLRLGMTREQMIAALGQPDQVVNSGDYHGAIYVFPRQLGSITQAGFKITIYLHIDATGSIQALLHDGKIVSLHMQTSPIRPMPFKVGGIAAEQPIASLLSKVKTPARWNAAHDIALFAPYPIAVQINAASHRISGITIATTTVH